MTTKFTRYQICIKEHLDERWEGWFEGLTIRRTLDADGQPLTVLTGELIDQAALYGTLNRLRDLGLTLIRVELFRT